MDCSHCPTKGCSIMDISKLPGKCPSRDLESQKKFKEFYQDPENHKLAYNAALTESSGYKKQTRIEETIAFLKRCEYKNIGLAFCSGLRNEGKIIADILKSHGFNTESILCKNGGVEKEFIGIKDEEKVRPGTNEPMCNPIGQAMLLNEAGTDFNLIVGLCVGHDSLFIKYSDAPVSVLIAKDRVLCHNPVGAIYQADAYYKHIYGDEK